MANVVILNGSLWLSWKCLLYKNEIIALNWKINFPDEYVILFVEID